MATNMKTMDYGRGFIALIADTYPGGEPDNVLMESSKLGSQELHQYINRPPASEYLWVGEHHHLNREQVAEVVMQMQHWLETGRLKHDN